MKKILVLVMSLVLLGGMVFGATETAQEFKITTTINGVLELKVLDTAPVNNSSLGTHIGSYGFGDLTDGTGTKTMTDKYLVVRTNQKTAQKITFTVGNLIGASYAANVMEYTMNFGAPKNMELNGGALSGYSITSGTGATNQININTINGLTVHYVPFDFSITEEQYEAANADVYSATITFNISAL